MAELADALEESGGKYEVQTIALASPCDACPVKGWSMWSLCDGSSPSPDFAVEFYQSG